MILWSSQEGQQRSLRSSTLHNHHLNLEEDSERELSASSNDDDEDDDAGDDDDDDDDDEDDDDDDDYDDRDGFTRRATLPLRDAKSPGFYLGRPNIHSGISYRSTTDRQGRFK